MKLRFRKATAADIDAIAAIYTRTHDAEEASLTTIGWIRLIYPTRDTAIAALERGDLYVCEAEADCRSESVPSVELDNQSGQEAEAEGRDGSDCRSVEDAAEAEDRDESSCKYVKDAAEAQRKIIASAIINQLQVDVYADVDWEFEAADDEVSVLHTLVVDPAYRHAGAGRAFVDYWEKLAAASGCLELRMDTNARNSIARAFYAKLGYKEVGIVPTVFNGIPGVNLVMLEKHL